MNKQESNRFNILNISQLPTNLVSRIAPTPSGFLHIGNVFSFVITWLLVRKNAGKLILRIDDLDAVRTRQDYLEDIFETLDWLGLQVDEGASGVEDFIKNYSQLHRLEYYHQTIRQLADKNMLFSCDCSRSSLKNTERYQGTCYDKTALDLSHHALRIRVLQPSEISFADVAAGLCQTWTVDDFVVRRRDGVPAYQVASLTDDVKMNVNFIVRGEDLIGSTFSQIYLAKALDIQQFVQTKFLHHLLIRDESEQKLSKSQNATPLRLARLHGDSPRFVYEFIGEKLGLGSTKNLQDLFGRFSDLST